MLLVVCDRPPTYVQEAPIISESKSVTNFRPSAFTRITAMLSLTRRLTPSVLWMRRLATGPASPPRQLSEGEQAIHTKLTDRFAPSELLVQDVSGE